MASRYDRLLRQIEKGEQLSSLLSAALRLAMDAGDDELAVWIQLELLGYVNGTPGFNGQMVPEYRAVGGRWLESYGRHLLLETPDLMFVNQTRLRHGVSELESYAGASGELLLPLAEFADIINRALHVQVSIFAFRPTSIPPVLAAIRSQLLHRLLDHRSRLEQISTGRDSTSGDVILLQPNFSGVGIDLRAFWRKWRSASSE